MKQIRRNVFETNSSSTHSFSHCGGTYNDLSVDYDGYVHTQLGEFGWEIEDYFDSASKLAYILLVAAYFSDHSFWYFDQSWEDEWESFKETDEFKDIEDTVKSRMNCEGIIIDEKCEGYIDHQSLEDYHSLADWLSWTGADSIEDFIFGGVVLHTDNDNH
jgi:hypothetical protein